VKSKELKAEIKQHKVKHQVSDWEGALGGPQTVDKEGKRLKKDIGTRTWRKWGGRSWVGLVVGKGKKRREKGRSKKRGWQFELI